MKKQNKRIKNKGLKLWRFITLKDLPVILAIFLFNLAVSFFALEDLSIIIKVITFIVLTLILSPLIFFYPSQQCKGYVFIYRWFVFLSKPKKYTFSAKNANTKNLVPYIKAEEDFIKVKNGYFGALQIDGLDLSNYDEDEIQVLLNNFTKTLNLVSSKVTIVKIPKLFNLSKNKEYLEKNFITKNNDVQENIYDFFQSDLEDIFENQYKDVYYLIVYDTTIENLKKQIKLLSINLFNCKLENKQLGIKKLLNLTLEVINPASKLSDQELKQALESKNLAKHFRQKKIKFRANNFNVGDYWYSVQSIGEYPFKLDALWTSRLFNSPSIVIWNLDKLSEETKKKRFDRTIRSIESNYKEEKNKVVSRRNLFEYEALDQIVDIASSNSEEIFESDFIFLNRALTKKELLEIEDKNKINVKSMNGRINKLKFRQFEGLGSIYFKLTRSTDDQTEIIASNIAYGWPFATSHLNDENYNLLATSLIDNSPIFFDQFKNNDYRKNNNLFILGTSGSGKSTITNKLITYNLTLGNKVILIDPQNEYENLGKKFNGSVINIGSGFQTTFNPLQIQKNFDPNKIEGENNNSSLNNSEIMMLHEQNLEKFFESIFPDISSLQIRTLGRCWKELYKKWNIDINSTKDISTYKNEQYPIIDDLIKELEIFESDVLSNQEKLDLLDLLDYEFGKEGKLRKLYNGKTNFSINNQFTIFNVAPLLASASINVSQASFFLMMSFIQGQISNNINSKNKILFIVDEAHKFIDEKNTYALDIMSSTWKTIRKFNGGAIATTQNPRDFSVSGEAKRKSEAIIDNSQYAIICNLKSKDIDIVDELYKNSGGLTQQEKLFISGAKIGEFLFSVSPNQRFIVDSYFNEYEKDLYFRQGDKRVNE
ncbi:Mbov_0397 family ICE element conjugal transfer ATPase [[Mycoplasma] collis]|uniref:Mbov_0397 family ICE element conjugal transfer ATPase n=1 Tax=[Mycoplasma] collis TaxID=2127 RepID=UPI00051BC188|nr:DUF87 domain-containing protein [[Mycoplasma] collis]